jgi:hypothetical protein
MVNDQLGNFSLWYRFRATVVFNLLHLGGPAHLDGAADPRQQLEHEYLQRKEAHQAAKQGRPVRVVAAPVPDGSGSDPLMFLVILGVVAMVALVGFAVAAAH